MGTGLKTMPFHRPSTKPVRKRHSYPPSHQSSSLHPSRLPAPEQSYGSEDCSASASSFSASRPGVREAQERWEIERARRWEFDESL